MQHLALIFDFDGTMAVAASSDGFLLDAVSEARTDGAQVTEKMIEDANSDLRLVEKWVPAERRQEVYERIVRNNIDCVGHAHVDAALLDAIRALARDHTLFIFSGRDERSLLSFLETHQLRPLFQEVVADTGAFAEKPDRAALEYLFKKYALEPGRCVYVGDKMVDVELARAAGCRFIAAGWYHRHLDGVLPKACMNAAELIARVRAIAGEL